MYHISDKLVEWMVDGGVEALAGSGGGGKEEVEECFMLLLI